MIPKLFTITSAAQFNGQREYLKRREREKNECKNFIDHLALIDLIPFQIPNELNEYKQMDGNGFSDGNRDSGIIVRARDGGFIYTRNS